MDGGVACGWGGMMSVPPTMPGAAMGGPGGGWGAPASVGMLPSALHTSPAARMGPQMGGMQHPGGAPVGPLAAELRRLFLELSPEDAKRYRASELLRRASDRDVVECFPMVLDKIVNFQSAHGLGIHILGEMLRCQPVTLVNNFAAQQVYDLFNPKCDDGAPAAFLHALLCYKHSQGLSAEPEGTKLHKLLLRRSRQQDLRRVPASPLRAWLGKIWLDAPSSRPDRQTVTGCCARWVADQQASLDEKMPCLALMRQEAELRGRPEGDAWLVSNILEQVCRDPRAHSPDLQHLLWLAGAPPAPALLKPLLAGLAQERGRLATLWVCLSLWPPRPKPQDLAAPPWPPTQPPPIHALLRAMLMVFSQLAGADDLCRTSALALGAIASSGDGSPGSVAAGAADLLLLLHKDGPMLPSGVWMPLVPLLEQQLSRRFPAGAELLARLRQRGSGASLSQFASAPTPGGGGQGGWAGYQQQPGGGFQQQGQGGFGQQPGTYPQQQQQGNFQAPFASAPNMNGGGYYQQQVQPQQTQQQRPHDPNATEIRYEPPRVGLQNTNNTCYMNSFIQSLYMTNQFVSKIFDFQLKLKKNPSKVDEEDFEFGLKLVELMQKQVAKMALTKHKHTDIWEILQAFPGQYRSGEQQDVTETIRFVFDKLGSFEQPLIREVFAGELSEHLRCQVCGTIKTRPETFTDLVLPVPKEEQVRNSGAIPTTQQLLDARLQFELMDADEPVFCETCQHKQRFGKWCEITSPPAQLCICLNRFSFNLEAMAMVKEKTPVRVDGAVQIGQFTYLLYFVIVHTGKDATSGHYYAIGHRSEDGQQADWVTMDDSQLKPADLSILQGAAAEKQKDDNPYVLFYRCVQAPPTPPARVPPKLAKAVRKEDDARQES